MTARTKMDVVMQFIGIESVEQYAAAYQQLRREHDETEDIELSAAQHQLIRAADAIGYLRFSPDDWVQAKANAQTLEIA